MNDPERRGMPRRGGMRRSLAELARIGRRVANVMFRPANRSVVPTAAPADALATAEQQLVGAARQIELIAENLRSGFAAASDSEQRRCASACAEFMRAARTAIDPLLFWPLPHGHFDFAWLTTHAHRETLTFYADIWEIVFDEACRIGKSNLRILDAGCGSGIGAQMLAILLRNAKDITCEITCSDAFENYAPYIRAHFDAVNFVVSHVEDMKEKFDIVLCSHLIEHFADPFPFIKELQKRASHTVVLYAPFEEEPRIYGHFYSFRDADLARMGARFHKIVSSKAWPPGKCFVAVLDGSGS